MTQAQRKKALAEAQERLNIAENALLSAENAVAEARLAEYEARREVYRNEPLTEAQKNCLMLMVVHTRPLRKSGHGKGKLYIPTIGWNSIPIRDTVFDGLLSREMLGEPVRVDAWCKEYPLSYWGRQVAEALAKPKEEG